MMMVEWRCGRWSQRSANATRALRRWGVCSWLVAACVLSGLWGCPQRVVVRQGKRGHQPSQAAPIARSAVTKRAAPPVRPTNSPPNVNPVVKRQQPPLARPHVRGTPRTTPSPRTVRSSIRKRQTTHNAYHSFNAYRYYLRGQLDAVEGRSKQSIIAFKSALVYHPKSVFLRHRIALQFHQKKRLAKARYWALQALRFDRKYAPSYFLLGQIAVEQRQPRKALGYLRSAIAKSPLYADAYLAINKVLQTLPASEGKRSRLLKQMIRHLPARYEGYYHLAHLRQNQGRLAEAIRLYRSALNRKPSHHSSLFQLAHLYGQQKQWKQATRAYRVLLDYQPNAWQTHVNIACLYLQHGAPQDAQIAEYHFRYIMREATQYTPAERSNHIGTGLLQCRQYKRALPWLKRALKLQNHQFPLARLTLGMAYMHGGKPKIALGHFRAVPPKERSIYVDAQLYLLQTLLQLGQTRRAWLALERARIQLARHPNDWIRLSQFFSERAPQDILAQEAQQLQSQLTHLPNHKGLLHLLSYVYFRQKKYPQCEATLLQIIQRDARHSPSLNFLGYLYAVLGQKLSRAEKLVLRALKLSPGNPYFLDTLGWIYYRQGFLPKARRVLEQAFQQLPHDATVLIHLGRTYHRQKQWQRARKMYDKARRLKPPLHLQKQIEQALQKLKRRVSTSTLSIEM